MARLPEFDRNEVSQAALQVFWRNGYESTTIEMLTDAMGLSRSSLYSAFGGKEGLFLEVIDCYIHYMTEITDATLSTGHDPLVAIRSFLEYVSLIDSVESREYGCLVFNTISELSQTKPHLAEVAVDRLNDLRSLFFSRLKEARANNLLRTDKSVAELADYLISVAIGLRMHCKIKTDPAVIREIININLDSLKTSFGNQVSSHPPVLNAVQ